MLSRQVPQERRIRRSISHLRLSAGRVRLFYLIGPIVVLFPFVTLLFFWVATLENAAINIAIPAILLLLVSLVECVALPAFKTAGVSPDLQSETGGVTPWRLCDPGFSHWGVWRADLGRIPPEVENFRDRALVKEYIQKLLDDWTRRSPGGGRAIRIFGELTRSRGPFDDDPSGCKVYQITLEGDDGARRTGWLRLGPGWVEFQLARNRRGHDWGREISYRSETIGSATAALRPASVQLDPMWDRWVDG
jgi:hypothetical protein